MIVQSEAAREAQRAEMRQELTVWLKTLAGVPPELLAPPEGPGGGAAVEEGGAASEAEEEAAARADRIATAFSVVMARARESVAAAVKRAAEAEAVAKELGVAAAKVAKERGGRLFFVVPETLQAGV